MNKICAMHVAIVKNTYTIRLSASDIVLTSMNVIIHLLPHSKFDPKNKDSALPHPKNVSVVESELVTRVELGLMMIMLIFCCSVADTGPSAFTP